jgi:thiamine biosynthesis protein ThiS
MRIRINEEYRSLQHPLSIAELLEQLEIRGLQGVAVALNFKVVPKSRFADTVIVDGDQLDIIHATAGG